MYDSLTWWQTALDLAMLIPIVVGVGLLIESTRRRRRGQPGQRARLAVAAVALAVALAGALWLKPMWAPQRDPDHARVVRSSREFRSHAPPGIALRAPDGWNLSFDEEHGIVSGERGDVSHPDWAVLVISSTLLDDEFDLDRHAALVVSQFTDTSEFALERGAVVTELAGRPAIQIIKKHRGNGARLCTWSVKRGRRFASLVECSAGGDGDDPCTACNDALAQLEWLRPAGVDPGDL